MYHQFSCTSGKYEQRGREGDEMYTMKSVLKSLPAQMFHFQSNGDDVKSFPHIFASCTLPFQSTETMITVAGQVIPNNEQEKVMK